METGHTAWGTANHHRQQEMVDMAETCYESKDCQCQGCPGQGSAAPLKPSSALELRGAPEDTPLFPEWRVPLRVTSALLSVTFIYTFLREVLQPYLALSKNYFYKRRFPAWLEGWLCVRKQLGLLSFSLACLHALYSLCYPMRRSYRYRVLNWAYQQVGGRQAGNCICD
ncbi:hypothetical protein NHX12_034534 [Muraenolepis orangiensis]|uniref:Uncharacterized protein n=1 Tax=Muraenolepis orangiensis TaxID=630683 RepID=A0A9Q0D6G2_9TELE|nr:hypothetical protein NHX12_034534 [Muraenolepis orangiensis]